MNIDYSSYTNRGGRPINEDSLYCRSDCFIVADGLGGHENGEAASAQAVKYISGGYSGRLDDEVIARLLTGADNAVRTDGEGGKSTVAALFCAGNTVRFANVGDSRVYYFRHGQIIARTKDHSVCQAAVEMGELNPDDVRGSDDRSGLFKVLGASEPLKLPKPYDPIEIQDGDAFLLCSDGFWEYVYEMEMEADLLKSGSAAEWLRHMTKRLLLRSEDAGDNYTAVCGIIHAPELSPAVKRRVCSPVLIACLAVSLAALGTVTAVKLIGSGGAEPAVAPQPAAGTSEAATADLTVQTQDSIETAAVTQEVPTAETAETGEPAVSSGTAEQNETAEPSGTDEQIAPAEPAETTVQPAETAAQPAETAEQPAETAPQPPETDTPPVQPVKPPVHPVETAVKPAETEDPNTVSEPDTGDLPSESTMEISSGETVLPSTSDIEVIL